MGRRAGGEAGSTWLLLAPSPASVPAPHPCRGNGTWWPPSPAAGRAGTPGPPAGAGHERGHPLPPTLHPGRSQTSFSAGPRAKGSPRGSGRCPAFRGADPEARPRSPWVPEERDPGPPQPGAVGSGPSPPPHPWAPCHRGALLSCGPRGRGRRGSWGHTHPVKTKHSRVQNRMRTWLNMADWVRRMARWKSFCGTRAVRGGAWPFRRHGCRRVSGSHPPAPRPLPPPRQAPHGQPRKGTWA